MGRKYFIFQILQWGCGPIGDGSGRINHEKHEGTRKADVLSDSLWGINHINHGRHGKGLNIEHSTSNIEWGKFDRADMSDQSENSIIERRYENG
jgi:hypothetical protein